MEMEKVKKKKRNSLQFAQLSAPAWGPPLEKEAMLVGSLRTKKQVDWQETQKPKFLAASYKEHHVHLHHQHLHQDSNKTEENVRSSRENRDQR